MAKIASGKTASDSWVDYTDLREGIYIDVDTSAAKFKSTPVYTVALEGNGPMRLTCGLGSLYNVTPTGFRVYLTWAINLSTLPYPLTSTYATEHNWHIKWIGVED